MADAQLVVDIIDCAKQAGASPVWLLATAMQESGARYHPNPGDGGTSFGPFQHHRGGALGNHDRAWAESKAAVCERARAFAAAGVRDGEGAYRVQRPAARLHVEYVRNVNTNSRIASQIIQNSKGGTRVNPDGTVNTDSGSLLPGDPVGKLKELGNLITWIGDTHNMIRVAMVVGGVTLLGAGVLVVVKSETGVVPIPV